MLEENQKLDKVFSALSDSTRRSILVQLKKAPKTLMELADQYDMSFQGVSKHLKVLENAELLNKEKNGRQYICRHKAEMLTEAITWISHQHDFWSQNFDSLDQFLNKNDQSGK